MRILIPFVASAMLILVGCEDTGPGKSGPGAAAKPAPPPPPPPPPEKADVGVGKKGHGYGNDPLTVPLATLWRVKESVAFRIQIPQAMNLYKAQQGEAPKTHEEFMEKIIKANQIALPELPAGARYSYDPKKSEDLMVEYDASGTQPSPGKK